MGRKIEQNFVARIKKNTEKGGAWLATYTITEARHNGLGTVEDIVVSTESLPWSNASACKRWIKSKVLEHTPRKSIKLNVDAKQNDKPVTLTGRLDYKIERASNIV